MRATGRASVSACPEKGLVKWALLGVEAGWAVTAALTAILCVPLLGQNLEGLRCEEDVPSQC